jgi:hypothetical protein
VIEMSQKLRNHQVRCIFEVKRETRKTFCNIEDGGAVFNGVSVRYSSLRRQVCLKHAKKAAELILNVDKNNKDNSSIVCLSNSLPIF